MTIHVPVESHEDLSPLHALQEQHRKQLDAKDAEIFVLLGKLESLDGRHERLKTWARQHGWQSGDSGA